MSGGPADDPNRNKTVFRPSPLQNLKNRSELPGHDSRSQDIPDSSPATAPTGSTDSSPRSGSPPAPPRFRKDDIPLPRTPQTVRNRMVLEASPLLALAAALRSGRAQLAVPAFHRRATEAIAAFDRAIAEHYPPETCQRAKYALCATIDDIAQNLPGNASHSAEWARRSLVVSFFQENIGGDRFWQLVDEMLRYPADNRHIIELFHACLASGFEGRFRVMPDGHRRLQEIMSRLQGALEHVRSLSQTQLSPEWRGENAPLLRAGLASYSAMLLAGAGALLFLVYVILRLILMGSGEAPYAAVTSLNPGDPLTLSREGAALPLADSSQAMRLKQFLAPEIRQGLVTVKEDGQTVRVRTTVGELFQSGDDQLQPGRKALFERIGKAVETETGPVTIEGHADSDRVSNLAFPDNMSLSAARAETVAGIIRSSLTDPGRVTARGFGETQPIASNGTSDGKSRNRRVEVVLQRQF